MNKDTIERLLRSVPSERTPPDGLLATLARDVTLHPAPGLQSSGGATRSIPWIRRWLPALGFAAWFMTCVVVFGYQSTRIDQLKQEGARANAQLAVSHAQRDTSPAVAPAAPEGSSDSQAEISRLRAEIDQLRKTLAEASALRAENTRLRAELKARAPVGPAPAQDFFAVQQERASRVQCINHLKQLALAAHLHANDLNADVLTKDLTSLTRYLKDGSVLSCSDGRTAYQLVSPGASKRDNQAVFAYCPAHHNAALVEGSAHQLGPEQKLVDNGSGIHIGR